MEDMRDVAYRLADPETIEATIDELARRFIQTELRRQYDEDLALILSDRFKRHHRVRETKLRLHYASLGLEEVPPCVTPILS